MRRSCTWLLPLAALTAALVIGCKKEQDTQAQYAQQPTDPYGYPQYPPGQYPQQQYPTQPAQPYPPQTAQPAPATTPPPGGVPCQTDNDLVCPFGKCIGGRCGGCTTAEHCKPGATCMQTVAGMACVPAGMPGAPPAQ